MNEKKGYCITTRRLRLRCRHPEWLEETQSFFNEIAMFYYRLLLGHPELWELDSQKTLRGLELLSLPGRDKHVPQEPLPWEKVPLYFRRAAANAAIAAAKSFLTRSQGDSPAVRPAKSFKEAVVYYKGMYRDFTDTEITLKVWNGQCWQWLRCRLYGRSLPEEAQRMSPSVGFEGSFIFLQIPIREVVSDASTLQQRLKNRQSFCAVQFTNGDAFAVASIADINGQEQAVHFFKGGREYRHHCEQLQKKIEKSQKSMGAGITQAEEPNKKYWMHLKHLSEHYAHNVSAELIKFCQENRASVIVLPKYAEKYTDAVMYGSGNWSPLHLSTRIREYLQYKAWKNGILVLEVNARGISSHCARCGAEMTESDRKTDQYLCQAGHRGSRSLNSARNLSHKYLEQFQKHVGSPTVL